MELKALRRDGVRGQLHDSDGVQGAIRDAIREGALSDAVDAMKEGIRQEITPVLKRVQGIEVHPLPCNRARSTTEAAFAAILPEAMTLYRLRFVATLFVQLFAVPACGAVDPPEKGGLNKSIALDQTGHGGIQGVHLGPLNRTFPAPYSP